VFHGDPVVEATAKNDLKWEPPSKISKPALELRGPYLEIPLWEVLAGLLWDEDCTITLTNGHGATVEIAPVCKVTDDPREAELRVRIGIADG
jgi:hypothetical protein